MTERFTPFFVVDRPASLQIIRSLKIPIGKRIGLMTHANTSDNFKALLSKFPCSQYEYCEIIRGRCEFNHKISLCNKGLSFSRKIIKMADSGVFTKDNCRFPSYPKLYHEYDKMNVDFGVIVDFLKDKDKTIQSASTAIEEHRLNKWKFNIIGVAQGTTINEYIESYLELKRMGYKYIAIGGLLEKRIKSARYVRIRYENLLWSTLSRIRLIDPNGWIFILGCYAPSRHYKFLKYGAFGSDYKGWIFQYEKKYINAKRGNKYAKRSRYQQVRNFINCNVLNQKQKNEFLPNLIIVPCSKLKIMTRARINAIDLYNGPFFKLIRKYISKSNINNIEVRILSAKYGLIDKYAKISYYDERMDKERAIEMNKSILKDVSNLFNDGKKYNNILINLGITYMYAMKGYKQIIPRNKYNCITMTYGRIGERLSIMKKWLECNVYGE